MQQKKFDINRYEMFTLAKKKKKRKEKEKEKKRYRMFA